MPRLSFSNALLLIPLAISLIFLVWVLWNFTRERGKHPRY